MRSVNYIDSIGGPNIIEMDLPGKHSGRTTRLIKRDGDFTITVMFNKELLAVLKNKGDEITMLATSNRWIVIS